MPCRRVDGGAGGHLDERGDDPGLDFGSGDGGKEANYGTCFTFPQG